MAIDRLAPLYSLMLRVGWILGLLIGCGDSQDTIRSNELGARCQTLQGQKADPLDGRYLQVVLSCLGEQAEDRHPSLAFDIESVADHMGADGFQSFIAFFGQQDVPSRVAKPRVYPWPHIQQALSLVTAGQLSDSEFALTSVAQLTDLGRDFNPHWLLTQIHQLLQKGQLAQLGQLLYSAQDLLDDQQWQGVIQAFLLDDHGAKAIGQIGDDLWQSGVFSILRSLLTMEQARTLAPQKQAEVLRSWQALSEPPPWADSDLSGRSETVLARLGQRFGQLETHQQKAWLDLIRRGLAAYGHLPESKRQSLRARTNQALSHWLQNHPQPLTQLLAIIADLWDTPARILDPWMLSMQRILQQKGMLYSIDLKLTEAELRQKLDHFLMAGGSTPGCPGSNFQGLKPHGDLTLFEEQWRAVVEPDPDCFGLPPLAAQVLAALAMDPRDLDIKPFPQAEGAAIDPGSLKALLRLAMELVAKDHDLGTDIFTEMRVLSRPLKRAELVKLGMALSMAPIEGLADLVALENQLAQKILPGVFLQDGLEKMLNFALHDLARRVAVFRAAMPGPEHQPWALTRILIGLYPDGPITDAVHGEIPQWINGHQGRGLAEQKTWTTLMSQLWFEDVIFKNPDHSRQQDQSLQLNVDGGRLAFQEITANGTLQADSDQLFDWHDIFQAQTKKDDFRWNLVAKRLHSGPLQFRDIDDDRIQAMTRAIDDLTETGLSDNLSNRYSKPLSYSSNLNAKWSDLIVNPAFDKRRWRQLLFFVQQTLQPIDRQLPHSFKGYPRKKRPYEQPVMQFFSESMDQAVGQRFAHFSRSFPLILNQPEYLDDRALTGQLRRFLQPSVLTTAEDWNQSKIDRPGMVLDGQNEWFNILNFSHALSYRQAGRRASDGYYLMPLIGVSGQNLCHVYCRNPSQDDICPYQCPVTVASSQWQDEIFEGVLASYCAVFNLEIAGEVLAQAGLPTERPATCQRFVRDQKHLVPSSVLAENLRQLWFMGPRPQMAPGLATLPVALAWYKNKANLVNAPVVWSLTTEPSVQFREHLASQMASGRASSLISRYLSFVNLHQPGWQLEKRMASQSQGRTRSIIEVFIAIQAKVSQAGGSLGDLVVALIREGAGDRAFQASIAALVAYPSDLMAQDIWGYFVPILFSDFFQDQLGQPLIHWQQPGGRVLQAVLSQQTLGAWLDLLSPFQPQDFSDGWDWLAQAVDLWPVQSDDSALWQTWLAATTAVTKERRLAASIWQSGFKELSKRSLSTDFWREFDHLFQVMLKPLVDTHFDSSGDNRISLIDIFPEIMSRTLLDQGRLLFEYQGLAPEQLWLSGLYQSMRPIIGAPPSHKAVVKSWLQSESFDGRTWTDLLKEGESKDLVLKFMTHLAQVERRPLMTTIRFILDAGMDSAAIMTYGQANLNFKEPFRREKMQVFSILVAMSRPDIAMDFRKLIDTWLDSEPK